MLKNISLIMIIGIAFIECNQLFSKYKVNNNDMWLLVPGESVGKIIKNTSGKQLIKYFGKKNVVNTQIYIGEGEFTDGTIVLKNTKNMETRILLKGGKHV